MVCSSRGEEPDSDGPERTGRSVRQTETCSGRVRQNQAEDADDPVDAESGMESDVLLVSPGVLRRILVASVRSWARALDM